MFLFRALLLQNCLHAFISDIPSQMHPSPITLWQVILIFMVLVLTTQEIKNRNWTCVSSRLFDSQRCSPFWFLNPFECLPVQFFYCLLAGNTCIRVSCYFFSTSRLELICFYIFKSNILVFFVEICSFAFYLVNSKCEAYLAVDQSLVYGSYPKVFLLFFSLILSLIPVLAPSFLIHILVSFSFCFFASGSTGILSSIIPSL